MLILCDFDGTFTETDVTNLIWDRHLGPTWRERLLPPYRAGKVTTLELMAAGYRELSLDAHELLGSVRSELRLRSGFERLTDECRARAWPLAIVSNGLDWYIRTLLPAGIPFYCYRAELDGRWNVLLPEGCTLPPGQDFKIHICEQLRAEHPGRPTVFIGDGRNDFPVAMRCDRVFSVKGSTLARLCNEAGKPHIEFESFETVVESLSAD